ncbi:alpha/beta fold hydrolase [Chromatocurvus halotolerans]|uniref:Cholesterol oxidase n=1 Tax=Chromatocurvus halotolerans TaxID=1132028 RepID=A0A4R2KRX3_9GAMM|nr:alpha/beta fold hydrolase [Chromatocurvus halotolerans]TCO75532.1 choline dehydrogenase-like flavoprotein [Chromatocurvus halotolerans]
MKPISITLDKARDHYDILVVGSGYGGAVASSRLARAGRQVCLLERGCEILPGDFPDSISSAKDQFQLNTPMGPMGNPKGLFDIKVNEDLNALVGCGLGGTSLINANVALEFKKNVFDQDSWPEQYRCGDFLEKYYQLARGMLGANPYPRDDLNKLKALEQSARSMGLDFYKPPINVTFEDRINEFGVEQRACTNCGDCCSGCNYGSKNTTQMNYLPDAHNHGATIVCEARVERLEKLADQQWQLQVTDLSDDAATPRVLTANIVILSAGTFGSTEILLRSRKENVLEFSSRLGKRLSGNGDVLGFGYNNYWALDDEKKPRPVYGVGMGAATAPKTVFPGPCITGIIDNRESVSLEQGRVIEEGVIPGALAMALPPVFFFAGAQYANFLHYGMQQAAERLEDASDLGNAIANDPGSLASLAYSGTVSRTQTYLIMSYDDSGGTLQLDNMGNVRASWNDVGRSKCIRDDNAALQDASAGIMGQFIPNPMWSEPLDYKIITVHPLGGCCMGDDADRGAVSPQCEVFSADGSVHDGLYVMDGAVVPTAGAVNPLLTIAAIAEYAVASLAGKHGWTIDYSLNASRPIVPEAPSDHRKRASHGRHEGTATLAEHMDDSVLEKHAAWGALGKLLGRLKASLENDSIDVAKRILRVLVKDYPDFFSPGVSFAETMRGFATTNFDTHKPDPAQRISNDYQLAYAQGKGDGHAIQYDLTISAENLHEFTENHRAEITGHVSCTLLGKAPLEVTSGEFFLFNPDEDQVETWTMNYRLHLKGERGPLYFEGTKYLQRKAHSHWWTDVTTLYVDVYEGDGRHGKHLVQGMMLLGIDDAIAMSQTVRTPLQKHKHRPLEHAMAKLLASMARKYPKLESALDTLFVARFGAFVAQTVFTAYGGLLANLKNFPSAENAVRQGDRRALSLPEPERIPLTMPDGAGITLYRYAHHEAKPRRQIVLAPGFSVTADSFATPTVDRNLAEYLFHAGPEDNASDRGFDVWMLAYRASPDSGNTRTDYSIDDIATHDWPAAIRFIQEASGVSDVHAIAHCVGSMSLLMALLNGMTGVRSVISSQLTLHPVTNWQNFLKADIDLVALLEHSDENHIPDSLPDMRETIPLVPAKADRSGSPDKQSAALDVLCWQVPLPPGEECNNPVCRRVSAIFGPSYTHSQLNHATHIALEEWFDTIAVKPFRQLERIIEKQYCVNREGENTYLPQVSRLAHIPIHFIAGGRNEIFLPETSLRTCEWLKAHNTSGDYSRQVYERYAHMDFFIGRSAAADVYPDFLVFLEKHS